MSIAPTAEFLQLQPVVAGRYSLERELGRGGMGVVFLARDVALDRPVALKLLPLSLATRPELRQRFLREARTAAKLSHPNIVPIHVVEEHGELVFFVMTFVDGETLGQRVRRAGPLTQSQASRVVQEVAWALAYAHGRGVVHRDIKPDNILLDKDSGRAMVTDFGIARVAETGTLSGAGEILGTMQYMSPEQASGDPVDGRSDLFSLGVTAFYALTGKLPFDGPSLPAIALRIVSAEAPRLASLRTDIPVSLAQAVDRCLAKQPDERFASGEELAELLGQSSVVTETAPQIRYLLRAARDLDPAFAMLVAAGLVVPQVLPILWARLADRGSVLALLFIFAGPAVFASGALIHAARQVIKGGFGPADVERAFDRAERAAREEAESVFLGWGDSDERLANRRRKWKWLGHASMAAFATSLIVGSATHSLDPPGLIPGLMGMSLALGLLCYVGAFALGRQLAAKSKKKPLQSLSLGERLMGTGFVNWLFRVAGIGLDVGAQNEPPASERTEVLIASAAGDVFARLPAELKARFAAVPKVVRQLEEDAALLRKRESELSRAIAEANPAGEERDRGRLERRAGTAQEIEAARANVRERLAGAVAALENIRLDLLRLDAGVGSPDDLTADLERARAIGTAVDAEVYARKEVGRIIAESTG